MLAFRATLRRERERRERAEQVLDVVRAELRVEREARLSAEGLLRELLRGLLRDTRAH